MYSAHSAVNAVTYFARSDNGNNVLTKHFHQKDFEKLKSLGPKAIVTMLFSSRILCWVYWFILKKM